LKVRLSALPDLRSGLLLLGLSEGDRLLVGLYPSFLSFLSFLSLRSFLSYLSFLLLFWGHSNFLWPFSPQLKHLPSRMVLSLELDLSLRLKSLELDLLLNLSLELDLLLYLSLELDLRLNLSLLLDLLCLGARHSLALQLNLLPVAFAVAFEALVFSVRADLAPFVSGFCK